MNYRRLSPLRYPGGKSFLSTFLIDIINNNQPIDTYVEPFAGGAGAALALLFNKHVKNIVLNDADEFIYIFWNVTLNRTEELIDKIKATPINIDEWKKQKSLLNVDACNTQINYLDIAFATLYLNRCNRSGIFSSGPIGGREQSGQWKIDERFKKENLINRVKMISKYKEHITIYNYDAVVFLKNHLKKTGIDLKKSLIYLDPPYFEKGDHLYRKYFYERDHLTLHNFLKNESRIRWILSYDDVTFIRDLYKGENSNGFSTNHFAHKAKIGRELIILSDNCIMSDKKNKKRSKNFKWN